jgi:hypothetical protein
MPTPTYTALATRTLTSTATSVVFSNIPATYRDLILVTNVTHSANAEIDLTVRFNSDAGANYSRIGMTGNGSSAAAFSQTGNNGLELLGGSTTISPAILQVMDYSATDKHKSVLFRGNLTVGRVSAFGARWANTAAVNSMSVSVLSGNYAIGSTFSLYGIVA